MDQEQQKLLDTITKIEEDSLENNFYAHCTLAQKGLPEEFYTLKKSVEELLRRQWTNEDARKIVEATNLLTDWIASIGIVLIEDTGVPAMTLMKLVELRCNAKRAHDEFAALLNKAVQNENTDSELLQCYMECKKIFEKIRNFLEERVTAMFREQDRNIN